jgi:hypothetical protein
MSLMSRDSLLLELVVVVEVGLSEEFPILIHRPVVPRLQHFLDLAGRLLSLVQDLEDSPAQTQS